LARLPWRCLRRWSWTFLHQTHRERGSFNTSILVILSFSKMILKKKFKIFVNFVLIIVELE
jgi:hypothetical protein